MRQEDEATLFEICNKLHRVIFLTELLEEPLPTPRKMMTWNEFEKLLRRNCSREEKLRIVETFKEEVAKAETIIKEKSQLNEDEEKLIRKVYLDEAAENLLRKMFKNNIYFKLNKKREKS
jgi:hypothetical protein